MNNGEDEIDSYFKHNGFYENSSALIGIPIDILQIPIAPLIMRAIEARKEKIEMETTNVEEAVKTSEAVTKEVPKVIDKALEGLRKAR